MRRQLISRNADLERDLSVLADTKGPDESESIRVKIEEEWEGNKARLHADWRELSLRIQSLRENVLDATDLASDDLDRLKRLHICVLSGNWMLMDADGWDGWCGSGTGCHSRASLLKVRDIHSITSIIDTDSCMPLSTHTHFIKTIVKVHGVM